MYVVDSKFVFPQDVNPVCTHCVVSKLENEVNIIDRIDNLDTRGYVCDVVFRCVVTCHDIYI